MSASRRQFALAASVLASIFCSGCRTRTRAADRAEPARRIVSLTPNTTETVFALGAGKRIVGRSRFCDYPPEVSAIPSIGGYVDASLEAILALMPDLVVGARGPAGPSLVEKLTSLGIDTFFPATESMVDIDAMIRGLSERLGVPERGTELVRALRKREDAIATAVRAEPRVRVLLVFSPAPIVASGPRSFPDEMIQLANGENVIQSGGAYPTIGVEQLLSLAPDVIVDATMAGVHDDRPSTLRDALGFRELAAVREGRLVAIRDEAFLRPGPRIADGLALLARALHPRALLP